MLVRCLKFKKVGYLVIGKIAIRAMMNDDGDYNYSEIMKLLLDKF